MGNDVPDGQAGDLVFVLNERPHSKFKRKGNDLMIERDLVLVDALCGFEFTIKALDGRILKLSPPPNKMIRPGNAISDSGGSVMTIENEGMPIPNTGGLCKGNLYIVFNIIFPNNSWPSTEIKAKLRDILPPAPLVSPEEAKTAIDENIIIEEYILSEGNLNDFGNSGRENAGGGASYMDEDDHGVHHQQCQQS